MLALETRLFRLRPFPGEPRPLGALVLLAFLFQALGLETRLRFGLPLQLEARFVRGPSGPFELGGGLGGAAGQIGTGRLRRS